MACQQAFAQQLRRRGLRMTSQRERVLDALHAVHDFATAEEIHTLVQETGKGAASRAIVDISTVYRTLDLLRSFGMVASVDSGDGQTHYELLGLREPHLHLACQGCGGIFVVPMASADPLLQDLLARHGFEASLDDVTIPGLCAECRAANLAEQGPSADTSGS